MGVFVRWRGARCPPCCCPLAHFAPRPRRLPDCRHPSHQPAPMHPPAGEIARLCAPRTQHSGQPAATAAATHAHRERQSHAGQQPRQRQQAVTPTDTQVLSAHSSRRTSRLASGARHHQPPRCRGPISPMRTTQGLARTPPTSDALVHTRPALSVRTTTWQFYSSSSASVAVAFLPAPSRCIAHRHQPPPPTPTL